ncbi:MULTISPECIES: M14 family zinc carboxypeptidase [unclassified Undibacterium]|uniref:M14 family zinc carboxypeptidase n=1 Tax=unclassified Undibacterium TaxID=2630295 RepID=UPI002AC8B446|nr:MULTISPECIES: M14 family zinc carboxypeptidase [unclassified Undibacterium]MEB0138394.1 M14 family zinc carboxypeptidase [Undibacterium sp. CCC2.1]MEB0171269.1 M14 family zinc carboxypeptidase [Undibacterium sp. CCC1.1]MEB0176493.1 M14 family zinc carboxypeptidase [Undibacterium sp. CCC3.4]MEB0214022.1 M14 family zinc carboxypeptidase [Undibacterium sp. 5I2]WPX43638.1 M14 family zinc carboxypeptidase [Undibacterium sp. CCC3.4]
MSTTPTCAPAFITPYEAGNRNQTTNWQQCIQFYQELAAAFPQLLSFFEIGRSDAGHPIHAGIISADAVFDAERVRAAGRTVFFNNNGIHPGEPEGVDACMALVRDLCLQPARLAALADTVFLFIPLYNVDGSLDRGASSRVNQDGPEEFGFRGNSLHLDLNRDFIKCDSLSAATFNRFFCTWDPDVMVDTHTSNGADYQYTMTLIQTQTDKLGGALGNYLKHAMLPAIFSAMEQRGWPTCPYVNPIRDIPDHGIEDFLETPRFSTGYAALHHCIGFMPETHMLKPFADRYEAMRALVETVLALTVRDGSQIRSLRAAARRAAASDATAIVRWQADHSQPVSFLFKGYQASYQPSLLGSYQRLAYDRSQPWEKPIPYFNRFIASEVVTRPRAYLIPCAWRGVIERLQWNGVQLQKLEQEQSLAVEVYHILELQSRPQAYEGHLFHDELSLDARADTVQAQAGDYLLSLDQAQARYVIETLEPQAHDSFFRWGFFNSCLERKEAYSDYVFEDSAAEILREEDDTRAAFEAWRSAHPELQSNQTAVLDFIFQHCHRHREPAWRRYPVMRVL